MTKMLDQILEEVRELKNPEQFAEEGHYEEAQKSLEKAKKHKEDSVEYHGHMTEHYEKMSEWHSQRGRHGAADRTADKAEHHNNEMRKLLTGSQHSEQDFSRFSSNSGYFTPPVQMSKEVEEVTQHSELELKQQYPGVPMLDQQFSEGHAEVAYYGSGNSKDDYRFEDHVNRLGGKKKHRSSFTIPKSKVDAFHNSMKTAGFEHGRHYQIGE